MNILSSIKLWWQRVKEDFLYEYTPDETPSVNESDPVAVEPPKPKKRPRKPTKKAPKSTKRPIKRAK